MHFNLQGHQNHFASVTGYIRSQEPRAYVVSDLTCNKPQAKDTLGNT